MAATIVGQTVISLQNALLSLWASFLTTFPGIIAALVIILIGGIVGWFLGLVLTRALKEAKIDFWLQQHGLGKALSGLDLATVLGSILKWYIVIVFLGEAAALIKLTALQAFVIGLVSYVPLLIGAFVVFLMGLIIGEYAKNSIIKKMDFPHKPLIAKFTKFLVVYFAVVIGLQTANFRVDILIDAFRIGFSALVVVVSVVLGITFAFSIRKDAEKFWKKLKNF